MSDKTNRAIVGDFFDAIGSGDNGRLLALIAEDIEWIVPGKGRPLAGTYREHTGVMDLVRTESKTMEMSVMKT
jgi:ketosteroid isomerase-like protein